MYLRPFSSFGTKTLILLLATITLILGACNNDDDMNPGDIDPPILLCDVLGLGNMDENTVGATSFTFENNPNAPVDYVINCFPRVLVDVTIEPGTVIEFGEDAGLYVLDGAGMTGSLVAVGTADEPIILRGTNALKGWWRGLAFGDSDDERNELAFVTIDGAGSRNLVQGGDVVAIQNNSKNFKMRNVTLKNSGAVGFLQAVQTDLGTFSNNTFTDNNGHPVVIHANHFKGLDGTNSTYTGNTPNSIRMTISPGSVITVTEDQTWQNPGIPVLLDEGTLGIVADLKIEPGFELVLQPDCKIGVPDEGSFNAVGTVDQPIVIRGEQDVQGYWESFTINGTNTLNQLNYVTVANGGRLKPFGAAPGKGNLYLERDADNVQITNCTFAKSLGCGIYNTSGTAISAATNTFTDNVEGTICE